MRQCEFKRKYNSEIGRHQKQHIYGEGIFDIFSKTAKKIAIDTSKNIATTALNKTGNYVGNKAGEFFFSIITK